MPDPEKASSGHLTQKLEDLEFADDLALLSHRLQDMQEKVDALSEVAKRVGLKISQEKNKVLRTNNKQKSLPSWEV